MNPKKSWEDFLEWGLKNEDNRKRAMSATIKMMAILNQSTGKKISPDELKELAGGFDDIVGTYL
jgi:hypothetical protein